MEFDLRELTPDLWPDLERLFGPRGACGGCWCMAWRTEKGEKWADIKGAPNRARFKALVERGRAHGLLAYAAGEAVGWVSFDRRRDFAKLDRAPSLACDDADQVWSVPCFYVKAGWRNKGVAGALLGGAVAALRKRGARVVEGYPVRPATEGKPIAPVFAFTGTRPLFAKAGFKPVGRRDAGKQRVRLDLAPLGGKARR